MTGAVWTSPLVWLPLPYSAEVTSRCSGCLRPENKRHDPDCSKTGVVIKGAP